MIVTDVYMEGPLTKTVIQPRIHGGIEYAPEIVVCDCQQNEHQIVVRKYIDSGAKSVGLSFHLCTSQGLWARVVSAFRYIFKLQSETWDEVVITKENYLPIKNAIRFLDRLEKKQ
jgi:hypothetical protein